MKYLFLPQFDPQGKFISTMDNVDFYRKLFPKHKIFATTFVTTLTEIDDGQAEQD